jgi:hypothetical protein
LSLPITVSTLSLVIIKESGGLEAWLTMGKVPPELRKSLFDIIERDMSTTLPLTIEGLDAIQYPCLLSLESIVRPKGFYLLRGNCNIG